MSLITNWRKVAAKAWSVRLMYIASILTGCEAVLPLVGDFVPQGMFALLTFFVVMGAMAARFIVQQELHDD